MHVTRRVRAVMVVTQIKIVMPAPVMPQSISLLPTRENV